MRNAVLAVVFGASLLVAAISAVPADATVETPSASTADAPPVSRCSWVGSDLPLPSWATRGWVTAAGPNGYLMGQVLGEGEPRPVARVVWHNRVVSELPPPPEGATVTPGAINGRGEVVGTMSSANKPRVGFVYRDGGYQILPSPDGHDVSVSGINESGDIVGNIDDGGWNRIILWPANAPGTYRIITDDVAVRLEHGRAVGIDDGGRVVTQRGLIWSPDGSARELAGYGDLTIDLFQGGRIIGESWSAHRVLIEWDVAGNEVRRLPGLGPVGVNANGLLAAWYYNDQDSSNTLVTWRNGTFLGDVGSNARLAAVTDDDQLAGYRIQPDQPAQPVTWSCVEHPLAGSTYTPVIPTRLLDTRTSQSKIAARNRISLQIGTDKVPAEATAVMLNLTGLNATAGSYLSVYPADGERPTVSNLNLAANEIRANLVTVPLKDARTLWIEAGPAAVEAVVDLEGFYSPNTGSGFTSLAPRRVLDTRDGTGRGGPFVAGKVQAGQTVTLDLSRALPEGATAVVFNLTAVEPTGASFVTAWPAGAPRPLASNLNVAPGKITPNLVTVGVSADRKVNLYNHSGQVDLVADLAGYYWFRSSQVFHPLAPSRVLDTRDAAGRPLTPIPARGTRALGLTDWLPADALAAVLNLTGTNVTAPGTYVTAWPAGQPLPTASNLNLVAGQTAANLAVVTTGSDTAINLYNHNGQVDMVVDVSGYFAPQPLS
jgi:hypothetical protein